MVAEAGTFTHVTLQLHLEPWKTTEAFTVPLNFRELVEEREKMRESEGVGKRCFQPFCPKLCDNLLEPIYIRSGDVDRG